MEQQVPVTKAGCAPNLFVLHRRPIRALFALQNRSQRHLATLCRKWTTHRLFEQFNFLTLRGRLIGWIQRECLDHVVVFHNSAYVMCCPVPALPTGANFLHHGFSLDKMPFVGQKIGTAGKLGSSQSVEVMSARLGDKRGHAFSAICRSQRRRSAIAKNIGQCSHAAS